MREELSQKVGKLADKLFDNGKNPIEAFGLDWESLSSLEAESPELVCKKCHTERKTA